MLSPKKTTASPVRVSHGDNALIVGTLSNGKNHALVESGRRVDKTVWEKPIQKAAPRNSSMSLLEENGELRRGK